MLLLNVI